VVVLIVAATVVAGGALESGPLATPCCRTDLGLTGHRPRRCGPVDVSRGCTPALGGLFSVTVAAMGSDYQPDLDDIEACLSAVVAGRMSRDGADRWAARWTADDSLQWDDLAWWTLTLIHGIDMPIGPEGGFLHDDEQIRGWLLELRQQREGRLRVGKPTALPSISAAFTPPSVCDQCPHPIGEHALWEPDETCGGWMHCTAPGCDQCWHDWPRLSIPRL
jgi:hypothetical protein